LPGEIISEKGPLISLADQKAESVDSQEVTEKILIKYMEEKYIVLNLIIFLVSSVVL
jgi:hypothetical protein